MPLHRIPVTVPYTLVGDATASLFTVQVDTVATAPTGAIATAQVLVEALARMRHPGRGAKVVTERVRVGAVGSQVSGLYAYVLANSFAIARLEFAARIDQEAAQQLADTFAGIDQRNLFGILADAVYLNYVSSMGLAAIASNAQRVRLRLIRPQEGVLKVLDMVGLRRMVPCFPDLPKACDDLVAAWMRQHAAAQPITAGGAAVPPTR
jgi:anti-anti-sigma regulatory factor